MENVNQNNLDSEKIQEEIKIIKTSHSAGRGIPGFIVFVYKDVLTKIINYDETEGSKKALIDWFNKVKDKENREKEQKEEYCNYLNERIKKPTLKISHKFFLALIKKAMDRDRQAKEAVVDYWNQSLINMAKDLAENFLSPYTPLEILQRVEAKLKEARIVATIHSSFDTEMNPISIINKLKKEADSIKEYAIKELFFSNGQCNKKRLEAELQKREDREKKQQKVLERYIKDAKIIPNLAQQETKNLVGKLFIGDKSSENKIYQAYRKMAVITAQKEAVNSERLKRIVTLYELIKIGERSIKKSIRDFVAENYEIRKNPFAIKGYIERKIEIDIRRACEGRPMLEDKNIELFSRVYYL